MATALRPFGAGCLRSAYYKTAIQRQIDATDLQMDRLVYKPYDPTDDEIRIVEEATRN